MATVVNTFRDKRSELFGGGLSNIAGGFAEEATAIKKRQKAAEAVRSGDFNTVQDILAEPDIDDNTRQLLSTALMARKRRASQEQQNKIQNSLARDRIQVSREQISSSERTAREGRQSRAAEGKLDRNLRREEIQSRKDIAAGNFTAATLIKAGTPEAAALAEAHPEAGIQNLTLGKRYELKFKGGKFVDSSPIDRAGIRVGAAFGAKQDEERRGGVLEAAKTADSTIQRTTQLGRMLSQGVQTGKFQPALTTIQGFAADANIDFVGALSRAGFSTNADVSTPEHFATLSKQLGIEAVQKFKGNTSDKELVAAEKTTAELGKSEFGNMLAVAGHSAIASIAKERAVDLIDRENAGGDRRSVFLSWEQEKNKKDATEFTKRMSTNLFNMLQQMPPQEVQKLLKTDAGKAGFKNLPISEDQKVAILRRALQR